jgi:hypothetical protein
MSSCVRYTAPCAWWNKHEPRQLSVFNIRRIVWKNYAPVQAQINFIVLNNILQISSNSPTNNIHNKIVPGYRIESTIPTVLHCLWMKFLLMCRPATFTGLSFTVSLIRKGMTVAALVHCIVVTLIIHIIKIGRLSQTQLLNVLLLRSFIYIVYLRSF